MLLTCDGLGKLVLPEADIMVHLCVHYMCKDCVGVGPRAASVRGSGPTDGEEYIYSRGSGDLVERRGERDGGTSGRVRGRDGDWVDGDCRVGRGGGPKEEEVERRESSQSDSFRQRSRGAVEKGNIDVQAAKTAVI